jgi:hypothetical protein
MATERLGYKVTIEPFRLWVPRTSSMSCDQAVFVDYAADARVSSDTVLLKIDRSGSGFSSSAVRAAIADHELDPVRLLAEVRRRPSHQSLLFTSYARRPGVDVTATSGQHHRYRHGRMRQSHGQS